MPGPGRAQGKLRAGTRNAYAASGADTLTLSGNWHDAEFNIFGDADGSEAQFNSGSSVEVNTQVQSSTSTTAAPIGVQTGFTGETNNLNFDGATGIQTQARSINFTEDTNTGGATSCTAETGTGPTPALLTKASVRVPGGRVMYRWSVAGNRGVAGFNLYAAGHRINRELIPRHSSLQYRDTLRCPRHWERRFAIEIVSVTGQTAMIRIT